MSNGFKFKKDCYYKLRATNDKPLVTIANSMKEVAIIYENNVPTEIEGYCRRSASMISTIEAEDKVYCIINCEWEAD